MYNFYNLSDQPHINRGSPWVPFPPLDAKGLQRQERSGVLVWIPKIPGHALHEKGFQRPKKTLFLCSAAWNKERFSPLC